MEKDGRHLPLSSHPASDDTSTHRLSQHENPLQTSEVKRRAWLYRLPVPQLPVNTNRWYQQLNPLKWGVIPQVPSARTPCPEKTANTLSSVYFTWISPLMTTGYRRNLESNDIWTVNSDRAAERLCDAFQSNFKRQRSSKSQRALLMALYGTFKRDFWKGGLCLLVSSIGQVLVPFALRFLLAFLGDAYAAAVEDKKRPPLGRGLGILFGILFIQLVQSVTTNQFLYHGAMVGAQARGLLTNAIFGKSLTLSFRAKAAGQGYSDGRIMNLISMDVARIDLAAGMLHMMWAAPLTIIACLVLLIVNITYAAVAGFGLLVISIPSLTIAAKSLARRRKAIAAISDARVSLASEVLKSIRFVKYNAWESPFLTKLKAFRKREMVLVAKLLTTRNAIYVLSVSTPIFAAMISFIVYSTTGHALSVGPVFSSLALFNALRIPLSLLPMVIGQMADAMTCLKRIEDFLVAEEHDEGIAWEVSSEKGVMVERATFTWETTSDSAEASSVSKMEATAIDKKLSQETELDTLPLAPFTIKNLDFTVGRNELLAVIGTVGSGKTSLLSALAGEMRRTSGNLTLGSHDRAFCPQQAWIQNSTLRDNILFGKPYHSQWYETVVRVCSLESDFEQFPSGDHTEVGERGANLSGGQRQRINIARAIYSGSNIVLLDDPLSALDAHVGKHLFEQAICGVLKDKCRVLATHQLHVLSQCDRVLWLDDGKVKELDTFDGLMTRSAEFRQMMISTAKEGKAPQNDFHAEVEKTEPIATQQVKHSRTTDKLMKEESRGDGHVPWSVYRSYVSSSGHLILGAIPILLLLIAQGANAIMGLWLGFWTSNRFHMSRNRYIAIYVALAVSQALFMFLFTASISNLGSISSRRTLDRSTEKVMRSPQAWHDTQPLGRIVGRLSRDADVVDNQLPDALRMFLYSMILIATVIAMLIYYLPYFAIALVPILAVFLFATTYFRVTARSLRRHEAQLRSKLFARFSESVSGVVTIRAFGRQDTFKQSIHTAIDDMNGAYYLTKAAERWLAMRLDLVANAMVLSVGLLVVIKRNVLHPSISGVLLAYLLSMIHFIQLLVRQVAEVQTGMVSMERLHEYATTLDSEPEVATLQPPLSWPATGKFTMRNVCMRYRPDLPLVLDGINMTVRSGEKIAIVGRTGAGKSSVTQAFFRLVELSAGRITIDGVDIAQIPLHLLRSRITIITQDPTMFQGTIRDNLDPFESYSDFELNSALQKSGLLSTLKLDAQVSESGTNLSTGTRQLVSLARALFYNRQLVFLDEATSSMDSATDMLVQQVIQKEFEGKTVVTIAHRLKSILKYDRVIVMDKGNIVEVGTPQELWVRGGVFEHMCRGSGIGKHDFDGC